MKIICKNCGCHFPQDFNDTLRTPCNYWGDVGMSNVDTVMRREIWDWIFKMPSDKFWLTTGLHLGYTVTAIAPKNIQSIPWNEVFSNYNEMSEEEQQNAQRSYYRGDIKYLGEKDGYGTTEKN